MTSDTSSTLLVLIFVALVSGLDRTFMHIIVTKDEVSSEGCSVDERVIDESTTEWNGNYQSPVLALLAETVSSERQI